VESATQKTKQNRKTKIEIPKLILEMQHMHNMVHIQLYIFS